MPITITRQDGNIKFYGSHIEPIVTIYSDEPAAMLSYTRIVGAGNAAEISDAVMIAGLFVDAILNKNTPDFKTSNIKVTYLNESDLSRHDTTYSMQKLLYWIESNKIVTVNKKKRLRYQFTKFTYQDNKLVILYKPVAW